MCIYHILFVVQHSLDGCDSANVLHYKRSLSSEKVIFQYSTRSSDEHDISLFNACVVDYFSFESNQLMYRATTQL